MAEVEGAAQRGQRDKDVRPLPPAEHVRWYLVRVRVRVRVGVRVIRLG